MPPPLKGSRELPGLVHAEINTSADITVVAAAGITTPTFYYQGPRNYLHIVHTDAILRVFERDGVSAFNHNVPESERPFGALMLPSGHMLGVLDIANQSGRTQLKSLRAVGLRVRSFVGGINAEDVWAASHLGGLATHH